MPMLDEKTYRVWKIKLLLNKMNPGYVENL